ncbi:hypothetical protein Bbelb_046070 [Branchiostoma belcheri]|nr:hypothetical protein Bbelb_046070 [Branchiostoma belcheri]
MERWRDIKDLEVSYSHIKPIDITGDYHLFKMSKPQRLDCKVLTTHTKKDSCFFIKCEEETVASGGVVVRAIDCEPGDPVRFRVVPGTCLNMRPDVVPLGKALYTNFLTPPRCEWVPNFGWEKSY